jgi:peptidoglycan hydrolase-like protein with peptidoglycan-binding domain
LELGDTGEDVRALQEYLNAHGFPVALSGAGSPGDETNYFGLATQAALAKFQQTNGISPAVGYFGPKTRAFISQ